MAKREKLIPLPFQKKSILTIEDHGGRVLVADEMGTGKTLSALWTLKRNPDWLPALVICPASLKYNWEYEAFRVFGTRPSVCEGRSPPSRGAIGFGSRPSITIINYDILKSWEPYFKKIGFRTAIIDECHFCCNPTTQRTKAVRGICKKIPHVLALSGTPLVNRPLELFPVVNLLWPREFRSFWEYAQRYCDPKMSPWGWDFTGSSNLSELRERLLKLGMVRHRKKDVLKDLPDKYRQIVPCQLSDPREYSHASRHFLSWIRMNYGHKLRKAQRAEALVKVGYMLRLCARLKLKHVVDQVNDSLAGNDSKIVLFAIHKKAIDVLQRRIKYSSVVVDGGLTGRKRQLAVDQFQNDRKVRVLIGQHQAAGVGLTLTAASRMGIVEFGWRPGDHTQIEDRIHRIGQKEKSIIQYFTAIGTVEEKLCRILQEKQDVTSTVLDGGRRVEDINLHEELLKILSRGEA